MELTASNMISTLLYLIIPSAIVKNAILPGLNHDNLSIRHESLNLLLTMTRQLKAISLTCVSSKYLILNIICFAGIYYLFLFIYLLNAKYWKS
jgi:hypothetical protein